MMNNKNIENSIIKALESEGFKEIGEIVFIKKRSIRSIKEKF